MRLRDGMTFIDTHARINSLKHEAGLDDFAIVPTSPEEGHSAETVVHDYINHLKYVEERLENGARERAAQCMPPHLVLALLKGELDPTFYASFRDYGDWIVDSVRSFGRNISFVAGASAGRSTVERLKFGLHRHCEVSTEEIVARIAQVREWNATAFHSDERFDVGDDIRDWHLQWRVPATTIIIGLIDLAKIDVNEEVVWNGLSSDVGNLILNDVSLWKAVDGGRK